MFAPGHDPGPKTDTMNNTGPTNASPHLLSPFDLHCLSLRNRVVMAPLTRARAGRDRVPNGLMLPPTSSSTRRQTSGRIATAGASKIAIAS
jgi:2,4-dienoyl-CoA reductase-like NADH-dependent reductase (Old Yellow Enzyme family)